MPPNHDSPSTTPSPPSSPLNPAARVWAWDKSQELGREAKTERSAPSSYTSVYFKTSEWLVSPRASIVIQCTPKASPASGLAVCITDTETGQTLSLHGTEVRMDISDGWPVIIVSE